MKSLRFNDFVEYSGINRKLINAVKNQAGCNWSEFQEYLENVANSPRGAAGGFCGFIYYSETTEFWRKKQKANNQTHGGSCKRFRRKSHVNGFKFQQFQRWSFF